MNIPSISKKQSITLAIVVGVVVILLALGGDLLFNRGSSYQGDWRDSLTVVPALDATSSLAVQRGLQAAKNISSDNTNIDTTDLISRKLFARYIAVKGTATNTPITDDQAAGIANAIILDTASTTGEHVYALTDLNITNDNSEATVVAYSKALNDRIALFYKDKPNELVMVMDALSANDAGKLSELPTIVSSYASLVSDLLKIKTPSAFAQIQLRMIQEYEKIRALIVLMSTSLNDPAAMLSAIASYKGSLDTLNQIAADYQAMVTPK